MSTPAALMPRTEHPDYLATQQARRDAQSAHETAVTRLDILSRVVAEAAVAGDMPSERLRQEWYAARAHEEATDLAWQRAREAWQDTRIRLGLKDAR